MPVSSPSRPGTRLAWALAGAAAAALCAAPAQAQRPCPRAAPEALRTLVERFTSADCQDCWTQPQALLVPGPSALVVDWIVPGAQADEAPLSAAALPEARERLAELGRALPATGAVHVQDLAPAPAARPRLHVAQGAPVGEYLGAIVQMPAPPRAPGSAQPGPYQLSVVLVEAVPAGGEGSPIARNVARAAWRTTWSAALPARGPGQARAGWLEIRPLRIPEGAQAERLHVLAWLHDAAGRLVAAARSRCE